MVLNSIDLTCALIFIKNKVWPSEIFWQILFKDIPLYRVFHSLRLQHEVKILLCVNLLKLILYIRWGVFRIFATIFDYRLFLLTTIWQIIPFFLNHNLLFFQWFLERGKISRINGSRIVFYIIFFRWIIITFLFCSLLLFLNCLLQDIFSTVHTSIVFLNNNLRK